MDTFIAIIAGLGLLTSRLNLFLILFVLAVASSTYAKLNELLEVLVEAVGKTQGKIR